VTSTPADDTHRRSNAPDRAAPEDLPPAVGGAAGLGEDVHVQPLSQRLALRLVRAVVAEVGELLQDVGLGGAHHHRRRGRPARHWLCLVDVGDRVIEICHVVLPEDLAAVTVSTFASAA